MSHPRTLGELRVSRPAERVSVKEEMRRNLLRKLQARETIFPASSATTTRWSRRS